MIPRFQITVLLFSLLFSSCATAPAPSLTTFETSPEVTDAPSADLTLPVAGTRNLLEFLMGPPPAEVCPDDARLTLGEIDDESSSKFVRQVEACKGKAIAVEINSPGGGVLAAMEIQKALERHDKPTYCVVDGMAASAAFVTLQSCTYRYATPRGFLMAHEASMGAKGQQSEMTNASEALRVVNWGMTEQCARRMGLTHEEFAARISGGKEWYFSQADAMREHAIDQPADSVAVVVALVAAEN